ncbi:MAG TPA: hypothetical protein VGU74_07500, partial [Gemmatimonadales bacterium]|nr:hypothetical protein [Gemmatimonadales bacterium]
AGSAASAVEAASQAAVPGGDSDMARLSVDRFAEQLGVALGDQLVTLLLYGSAVREPGARSSEPAMNTLLIVASVNRELFARVGPAVRDWVNAKHPAPLVMTEQEWRDSADAFPIEYEDIQAHHRVLAGRDPWGGITVSREHARRQLEHELMGKLMHLRQAYAAEWSNPKGLTEVVRATWAGFLTMLRAVLRLTGRPAPASSEALTREAATLIGFAPQGLTEPAAYLDAVTRTAQYVNRMERNSL